MAESWRGMTWGEIGLNLRFIHPNSPAVAQRAEKAGKKPSDVSLIRLTGAPTSTLPVLVFEDGSQIGMVAERAR